jgi:RND family efflux transporter MFP subunit
MRAITFLIAVLFTLAALSVPAIGAAEQQTVEFDGIIEPHAMIDLGSTAEGIVEQVLVDRSSLIKKGQILVKLNASVEQTALEKASAVAEFSGEIKYQQTQLEFVQRVHNRVKQLNAISTQDKDQAATDINLTTQRLKKAYEARTTAQFEKKKAAIFLAQRTINSPLTGVVVDRYVSAGEYVNNQPLLRLAQINPLRIEVIVPAQLFGKIQPGMNAEITLELTGHGNQIATVTLVDKIIDSGSSTYGVRLELQNENYRIPSGQKCLVKFHIDADSKTKEKTEQI